MCVHVFVQQIDGDADNISDSDIDDDDDEDSVPAIGVALVTQRNTHIQRVLSSGLADGRLATRNAALLYVIGFVFVIGVFLLLLDAVVVVFAVFVVGVVAVVVFVGGVVAVAVVGQKIEIIVRPVKTVETNND